MIMLTHQGVGFAPHQPVQLSGPYSLGMVRLSSRMISNSRLGAFELKSIAKGLLNILGGTLNTVADVIDIPLGILSQGVDVAFNGAADALRFIPWIGDFLAEIVLIGAAVLKFALSIPGLVLHEFGNLLQGFAKALDKELTPGEKKEKLDGEKKKLIDGAPEDIRESVKAVLDIADVNPDDTEESVRTSRTDGGDTPPPDDDDTDTTEDVGGKTDLEKVLPIAVPVAAGGIVLALLLG